MYRDKDIVRIILICVKKEYKGNHLGKSLLSFCINYCFNLGLKNFSLHVSTTNMPALKLYKKLGFRINKFIEKYYHDENPKDNDAYYMTLHI